jgi:hypothetical protein
MQDKPEYHISADGNQGLVIGDHNTVIQYFTSSINSLSTDYAGRIQNFLIEYIGIPKRPVPFGGREADVAHLDSWLDDPLASPYLLLVAPAGRGKSALLVRWSQRLLLKSDLEVIFLPISVRFRTNLAGVVFAVLTARLAALHGEKLSATPDTPQEVWRGLMIDYLNRPLPDRRRLLLILDGLDEAADWEAAPDLFPLNPPLGLQIILSARYLAGDASPDDWLRRLGWDRTKLAQAINLNPLTRNGVADVLKRMSFPLDRLGARGDIVSQLYRLSEGDPLLVRLYVDDLWNRGETVARLAPEDLSAMQPGLEGYFARWWEDQRRLWGIQVPLREPAVQTLLNLLAGALGQLTQEDVLHLASSDVGLTTWTLEETLHPLMRFVLGDGRKQGYTFSHPRLGIYFYERLSEREQQAIESRFLNWGKETLTAMNAGQLLPECAPSYIVQYYGTHLERTGSSAEVLLSLVCNYWLRAWEALEVTYAGFLNDVGRAWRALELDGVRSVEAGLSIELLGGEALCALCRASVNSLAKNISPDLIINVVREKLWTPSQGLAYARQMPDYDLRARALVGLASYIPEPLKTDILQEALALTQAIDDERFRARVLTELVTSFSKNLLPEILVAAQSIKNEEFRVAILTKLDLSQLENLEDEALAMDGDGPRAQLLAARAPFLTESLLSTALASGLAVIVEEFKVEILIKLVPFLSEALQSEVLEAARLMRDAASRAKVLLSLLPFSNDTLISELLEEILRIENRERRAEMLTRLVSSLPEHLLPLMLNMAEDGKLEEEVLVALAPRLPKSWLGEALKAVQAIEDKRICVEMLVALAPALPESLQAKALETVNKMMTEFYRVEVLVAHTPTQFESLKVKLLKALKVVKDENLRVRVLAALVPDLPGDLLSETLKIVQTLKNELNRAEMLVALAPVLPESLQTDVLKGVEALENEEFRVEALTKIIPILPETLLMKALIILQATEDERRLAESLTSLVSSMPKTRLKDVLKIAKAIEDERLRRDTLASFIPFLSKTLLQEALKAMLGAARAIRDEDDRVEALAKLAPFLPKHQTIEIFKAFQMLKNERFKARILAALAPLLPEAYHPDALSAVRSMKDEGLRAKTMVSLLPFLSENMKREALETGLATTHEGLRAEILTKVGPSLPKELQVEALKLGMMMRDEKYRAEVIVALASYLSEDLLLFSLEIGLDMESEGFRAEILTAIVPFLPVSFLPDVLKAGLAFVDSGNRVKVLAELIHFLPDALKLKTLKAGLETLNEFFQVDMLLKVVAPSLPEALQLEILRVATALENEMFRAKVLEGLIPYLSEKWFPEILAAVQSLKNEQLRLRAYVALAPFLKEGQLSETLTTVLMIKNEGFQAEMLAKLGPFLTQELMIAVLAKAREMDEVFKLHVLVSLVPCLSENQQSEVLGIALTLKKEEYQAEVLIPLISQFPEGVLLKVFEAGLGIKGQESRSRVLEAVAPHLTKLPSATLYALWRKTLSILAYRTRQDLLLDLCALVPVISVLGGVEAIAEISRAIMEVGQWWP